uniref:Growth/differentiation factor 8 n=1 Tax=Cacopsylla melanoneura TaxID=428564 RepID=A0A8D9FAS1_9HEMI
MLCRYLTTLLLILTVSTAATPSTATSRDTASKRNTNNNNPDLKMLMESMNSPSVSIADEYSSRESTPLSGGGCPKCIAREEKKNYSLNTIREDILSKLGFTHPPNVTGKNLTIKAEMYDFISKQRGSPFEQLNPRYHHQHHLYQNDDPSGSSVFYREEEEEDFHFMTDRVLAISQPHHHQLRHQHPRGPFILQFKFSSKTLQYKVQGAILWVYLKSTGTSHNVPVNIEVKKLLQPKQNATWSSVISKKEIRRNGTEGHWVLLDVKSMVSEWFKKPKENYGIVIEASPASENNSIVTIPTISSEEILVPFLEVQSKDIKKSRTRRTTGSLTCSETSTEQRCCRFPLKVDFEAFGWDWIIAPKTFEANYCSGECQHMFLPKYTHTQLVRYANSSMAPCCAPRKTSRISILYFDNEANIIFGYLPDVVVDRCGCA